MNDINQQLDDAVADGRITTDDADAVRDFAAFLTDPEVGPPGTGLSPDVMRRHQDVLGLADDDIRKAEDQQVSK